MNCPCPCPDTCLRWAAFCEWAAEDPPDEVKIRHICERSAMGPTLPPGRPEVPEVLALLVRMRECPYRSNHPPCGCAGARCALRAGAIVSHQDCFACLQAYP